MVKVINNYTLIQKIGEGNFSQVYRAINTKKMGEFAVKIIPFEKYQQNSQLQNCTLNQINTLSTITPSQYIVKYEDHFQTKNNYYFVYQYCNGGTLLQALKKQGSFSQNKALHIFRQLLEAFKVLNRYKIMHRDIKPENILFSNGRVKLADFGFCKSLKPGEHMAKTMLGSPIYMAPEVLRGQNYTMKADIWSLGVVLYQMLFGVCPYQSKNIAMLISHINTNEMTMPLDSHPVSQKVQQLIKKLLIKDYFRRISWIQLFAYKIDEQGNFIENDNNSNTQKTPPYSNKSYSVIRDDGEVKAIDKSEESGRKYGSITKQAKTKLFYSEKYMNLVSQPIGGSNGTERKISMFNDNILQKLQLREEQIKVPEEHTRTSMNQDKFMKEKITTTKQTIKRTTLLNKHQECLNILNQTLAQLQKKTKESLSSAYLALVKIHHKLKEITQNIKVSETDLLDLASLINYEIIQVDRQLIETKQQILRRKMNIPNIPKQIISAKKITTVKSLEEGYSGPEVRDFWIYCNTEEG